MRRVWGVILVGLVGRTSVQRMSERQRIASDAHVPPDLLQWLQSYSREDALLQDAALINLDFWNTRLRGLGTTVSGFDHDGNLVERGAAHLTRPQLFAMALDLDATDPFHFLLHTLIWESATHRRRILNHLEELARHRTTIRRLLLHARAIAEDSPGEAYAFLHPPRRGNTIPYLGPASSSKVLYFSGAGHPAHPVLIVDDRVRASLSKSATNGNRSHYRTFTRLNHETDLATMHDLASSASNLTGRPVAADEVEMWATNRPA